MPSMNRSMSVPDTGSMWDMHTSASQPTGKRTHFCIADYDTHLPFAQIIVRVVYFNFTLDDLALF